MMLTDPEPMLSAGARPGTAPAARNTASLRRDWIIVAALTVIAIVLRALFLGDSLLDDELFMYRIVHNQTLGGALSLIRHTEKTPPLFFLLPWITAKFGDATQWSRVPSFITAAACIPLGYMLGLRTVGRRAGLVAAAFLAVSAFGIYYGHNSRAYAGLAFVSALSTLCLVVALATNRRRWWVAYGVAAAAVLYTHYTGVFVLVVQVAWALLTHRERLRELVVVNALVALVYVPWIPSFLVQQKHSVNEAERIALLVPPSLARFAEFNGRAIFGQPGVPLSEVPGGAALMIAVALIVISVGAVALAGWRSRERGQWQRSPVTLLGIVALAAPTGVGLYSLQPHKSFLLPRNFSSSWVAAELMLAWLLVSLPRRLAAVAVATMLAVMTIGAVRSFDRQYRNTQFRAAAEFIDARARPVDPVLEHFVYGSRGAFSVVLTLNFKHPHRVIAPGEDDARAWEQARHGARVFVVDQLPGVFKKVRHLPPISGPGKRFVLLAERHYDGIQDLLVGEYALAAH